MLEPKQRVADDELFAQYPQYPQYPQYRPFAQYRGGVFSNRNAPGSAELRAEMNLSRLGAAGARPGA
jgi:hypothetical protein